MMGPPLTLRQAGAMTQEATMAAGKRDRALRIELRGFTDGRVERLTALDLTLSFYLGGCDWPSGKIAMRSPRTEPSQSSLPT